MSRPSKRRTPHARAEARGATRAVPSIAVDAFPHFSTLCRAYLHEDFVQEHGSVAGALDAFVRDLPAAERTAAAAEGARLLTMLAELPLPRLRKVLASTFRSAWHPPTPRDVIALLERMRELA